MRIIAVPEDPNDAAGIGRVGTDAGGGTACVEGAAAGAAQCCLATMATTSAALTSLSERNSRVGAAGGLSQDCVVQSVKGLTLMQVTEDSRSADGGAKTFPAAALAL